MARRLPPLESLRVLVACVRHGNFSLAAAELGITPAAVSQRMRVLEAQLGIQLFSRFGPRLTTTDRAKALGQRLEHALTLMRVAVDDCRRTQSPLRVTCAPTFAAHWLLPRLAAYHALPGSSSIALDAGQAILPRGAFDVAIRNGKGPWPGYNAVKLLAEQATPMLSPKWIPRGKRLTLRRLLDVPLIPDPRWAAWFKMAGLPNAKPSFVGTRFPNYDLEARAAVRGIGAALLSPILFAELLAQGALVAPYPWVVEGPGHYWLIWAQEVPEPHFVKWMKSQLSPGAPR